MSLPRKRKPLEKTSMVIERFQPPAFPSSFPLTYLENAVIAPAGEGTLSVSKSASPARGGDDGAVTYVIKDPMARHYVHCLETTIWIYALQQEFFPQKSIETLFFEGIDARDLGPGSPQGQILDTLFGEADILPAERCQGAHVRHCIVIERAGDRSPINKFCEPSLGFSWKWVPRMQAEILDGLGITRREGGAAPRIVYARHEPPRHLLPELEEPLLLMLARHGEITPVDLGGKPLREQMEIAAGADIMIGPYGGALANALWLPPGALLIEIFPPGVHHYDHQILCEMLGARYFGLEGDIIHRDGGRFGPPHGHEPEQVNVPIETLNFTTLEAILARNAAA